MRTVQNSVYNLISFNLTRTSWAILEPKLVRLARAHGPMGSNGRSNDAD